MSTDNVLEWINSFDDVDKRKKLAVNYLDKYVEFCKIDHPDVFTSNGRHQKGEKPTYSAKYYTKVNPTLKKLHNNSFAGYFSTARSYLSQVGGIRLHDDDLVSINLPISILLLNPIKIRKSWYKKPKNINFHKFFVSITQNYG